MTGSTRTDKRTGRRGLIPAIAAIPALLFSCTTMEGRAARYIEELPPPQAVEGTITEADVATLPPVVQRYMRYSQVIGKPRIDSFSFIFEGKIRNAPDAQWMNIRTRQYNLLSTPSRIFYVQGLGMPMSGIDSYIDGTGRMHIKLFNLITIDDVTGPEMDKSALVTFLNDMVICPPAYFSVPVQWKQRNDSQAELSLTHKGVTVTATLTFGEDGRLLDWVTDDRYAAVGEEQVPDRWSTPMSEHGEVAGLMIPTRGQGIHDYDGEPYVYMELERVSGLAWNTEGLPPRR